MIYPNVSAGVTATSLVAAGTQEPAHAPSRPAVILGRRDSPFKRSAATSPGAAAFDRDWSAKSVVVCRRIRLINTGPLAAGFPRYSGRHARLAIARITVAPTGFWRAADREPP